VVLRKNQAQELDRIICDRYPLDQVLDLEVTTDLVN
jgi:hypothetical protein